MRSPQDFLTGVILLFVGSGALIIALGYRLGTPTEMGPGFFPAIVAGLLAIVGLVLIARSLATDGLPLEATALRPLVLIIGATVAFALVVDPLGLVPAIFVMVLGSGLASLHFGVWKHLLLASALAVLCYFLFLRFLSLPLDAFGPLFGA